MFSAFLLPDSELRESGTGPVFDLGASDSARPQLLVFTLGITHIVEQESLNVAIEGSVDGLSWPGKPLVAFSQKFYTGRYQVIFDLQARSDVRFLRAKWVLNRWGRGELKPFFCASLRMESQPAAVARVAAAI